MRHLLLALLSLLLLSAHAQPRVAESRQSSYLTKVFRISDEQARHLYQRGLHAARPDFFRQVVDSFPTDNPVRRRLPPGYYLEAYAAGAQLVYELRTVADREVRVLDNQVDLTLVVRDSLGRLLPTAQVAVAGRSLPFDAATQTYRRANGGRPGLVAVTLAGRTTFHPLNQTFGGGRPRYQPDSRPWPGRAWRRVVFGFPLGYLTRPVQQLVNELRHASSVSTGLVGLLRSPFNEDVRDDRQSNRERRRDEHQDRNGGDIAAAPGTRFGRWASYVATSQPRYRPSGDTLRLKARVLRQTSGRPYRGPLALWLGGSPGQSEGKRIALLRASAPGSYFYTLPLADSLGLRPDTYVGFRLKDRRGVVRASGQFRLEDYELKNSRYTLRVAEKAPRTGQEQAVYVRGTDANELNLLDARVQLSLTPAGPVGELPGRQVFVPDTLWTRRQPLDALGETRLDVPATALPDVDFAYQVQATLLTADNERRTEATTVVHHHDPDELHLELRADSVYLTYRHLGRSQPHAATLNISTDNALGQGWLRRGPVQLPCAVPVNPQADYYELRDAAGHEARLELDAGNADLRLLSDRAADSLVLAVDNPRRLPFWYYVYQGGHLRYRGYGAGLRLAVPHAGAAPWYASLHYWWGSELRTAEFTVARPAPQLRNEARQPAVAYPGQKIGLRYAVTDERGRPVPRADLTSYAYTSKFDQAAAPALPVLHPARPVVGRRSLRRFELRDRFTAMPTRQVLDWPRWRGVLGLDSLTFYRFLYPVGGFFHEYRPAPGGLTQVAVFVVDSGRVQPPVAVYVDGQPGYIYDVNQRDPYAVVADSGVHTLSIRTATRLVTLPGVYLRPLHKLTLSIDVNQPCRELAVEKRPAALQADELLALQRTVVVVDDEDQFDEATLRQGARLLPLSRRYSYNGPRVAGPFRPDSVLLRTPGGLRRKFQFEPQYRYSFGPQLLKMQCFEGSQLRNLGSPANGDDWLPLKGFAYTEADFRRQPQWAAATTPDYLGTVFDAPRTTPAGQGRAELRLPAYFHCPARPGAAAHQLAAPRYVLLTRPDQPKFFRLERLSLTRTMLHALPSGRYRIAVLLADSTTLAPADDLLIQSNGQTYYQLQCADQQLAGPLGHRLNQLLWRHRPHYGTPMAALEQRRVIQVEMPTAPQPGWRTVRGQVLDQASEEGLPGVTVLLKGTTIGVSTNADGSFVLQVPPDGLRTLAFSSIGYVTQEVELGWQSVLLVKLRTDSKQLDEVVVTAFGMEQTRRSLSGSVASVSVNSLAGKVAGVMIQGAAPGTGGRIMIRGATSIAGSGLPLILLDGLPFNGQVADLDPASIASIDVLKAAQAMGLYGSAAANGVLIIKTKKAPAEADGAGSDPSLAMRRHFRDYGWWRPLLLTDARGEARTEVVLPDDVTSWDSFVLASDDHGRTGTATGRVKSFRQLRAELAAPRFLVAGDRVQLLGKSLNYGFDSARVRTTFRAGGRVLGEQEHLVRPVAVDTLTFEAPAAVRPDSVTISFALAQAGGYQDGEQRTLPLRPAGTLERVGTFATLAAADTTVQFVPDPALGEATVHLESDPLPLLLAEIERVQHYAYLCNEQAASKLKALLLERRIRAVQQQHFQHDRAINFLIRKLLAGRYPPEGLLWGTWPSSPPTPWATSHVLEALLEAEQAGYKLKLDRAPLQAYLLRELDSQLGEAATVEALRLAARSGAARSAGYLGSAGYSGYYHAPEDLIRLLALLHRLGAPADFRTYLARLDRLQAGPQPLDRYLALTALRQQLGLPYQLDTLRRYRLQTQLGGTFYADTLHASAYYHYLLRNPVGSTLLAYRVLRTAGGHAAELARLRLGLLARRVGGYWTSTYETAEILATIGPDLLPTGSLTLAATARLSGGLSQTVTSFPFTAQLAATAGPVLLHKQGLLPVYATAYQTRWNPAPAPVAGAFAVRTALAGQPGPRVVLRAGQPAELVVTVDVQAEAQYVLLEVPIPAGCSYGDPAPTNSRETHREYLRHQTGIFIDYLPVGRHEFRIALQPRFRGLYTINPAKAELVYFPTKFGRSASKQAVVK